MGSLYKNEKLGYIKKDQFSFEIAIKILILIEDKIKPIE